MDAIKDRSDPTSPHAVPFEVSPAWIEQGAIRKEYREERECEMAALEKRSQLAEESAVTLAQTVIKSGFALNGGGIIALPAVVTLFDLDASQISRALITTGLLFALGLLSAWGASILGFFALAHKSDTFYYRAVQTARFLQGKYFPHQWREMSEQGKAAGASADSYFKWFIVERYTAIGLCLVSVALFLAASGVGGRAILHAPHKPNPIVTQAITP
jgi:hypothetical protein